MEVVAWLLLQQRGGASRRDSGALRSQPVTSLSAHRIKATLVSSPDHPPTLPGSADNSDLFGDYGRQRAYDEMFDRAGAVRPHCAPLFDELKRASPDQLSELQLEADK
jgi:hypothetical protein